MIRAATDADAESIARIYNHYILNTVITFEEQAVSADAIAARIRNVQSSSLPYLLAEQDKCVLGYAYATGWRERSAYRFSVETTIYLDAKHIARGLGSELYRQLLVELKERGLRTAIGGIATPNPASIALHEKFGFTKVAHLRDVGFKFDRWIDVEYWQHML